MYSQDELDQLLAPIALYPDQLLTQILIASTYPLEVVEAARFAQQNPNLTGTALDDAVAQRNWDPSVQSLTAFPQVLAMMDDKLDWTQRLGDAFLADQQRVMDTVQSLRRRAENAGYLQSTPQQSVVDQDSEIVIAPAQPDVVYVPLYDPSVVYGPWWAPAYPPWFWYPPPIYGYPAVLVTGVVFGVGWPLWHDHWGWAHPDWHGHHVSLNVNDNRFWSRPRRPEPMPGRTWEHSPYHRRGVGYADARTRDRFVRVDPNAVHNRQNFRGYEGSPNASRPNVNLARPSPGIESRTIAPPRPAPGTALSPGLQAPRAPSRVAPVFAPDVSRHQAQMNAQRGLQSRQSIAPPPTVSGHARPGAGAAHRGR